ncbi:hypothetical protein LTR85_002727 [Meristemomyces frigidus]|nr:hypothetical protein LTR85_002727 [Meristemomyces frigidus]
MAQMTDDLDDLGSFLDFGEIDLNNIGNVDAMEYGNQVLQAQIISHPNTPFDDIGLALPPPSTATQDFGGQGQYGMLQQMEQNQQQYNGQAPTSHPFTVDSMYQPSMRQAYHQSHAQQHQFQPNPGFPPGQQVPPTPNSFDMHGRSGQFLPQGYQQGLQQCAVQEQRYGLRKDDALAFTPMVSPAGTPQSNVLPEFTIPGAYFSPLTSPMLHAQLAQNAQQHRQNHQGYYTNPSTAPNSNATSPTDPNIDIEMISDGLFLPESAITQTKKPKRKVATPRSVASSARVRQSPIQKPQKRKSGTLSQVMSSREDVVNEAQRSGNLQPKSAGLQPPAAFTGSSEDGSISPEPLSESVMGPPPRPGSSSTQSPALTAQQKETRAAAPGSAATPKSLLSCTGNQHPINDSTQNETRSGNHESLEELQLPEAANRVSCRPPLTQINTQVLPGPSNDETPRLSARKTPKLGPLSTPSSARPQSALASPSALGSPTTASTPGGLLKEARSDSKAGRINKKRGSVAGNGSTVVSPAIRPRISPSIKPLLPDGSSLHSPTHVLLLASKSNYQNLLEGNYLPGVSYPDSLSTGLTSKRTSHKVAEQGRRNRINDALKEMQSLLPKQATPKGGKENSNSDGSPDAGAGADGDSKESKEDAATKSNNSKAATVESANVYIRVVQAERRQWEAELLQREAELDRLRQENEKLATKLAEQATATACTEKAVKAIDSASPAFAEA